MTEYMSIPQFYDHVMSDINERDADQVAEMLNELGWQKVVRCRDCRFYKPKEGAMLSCKFEYHGLVQWKLAEPDGFCSWAVRRDE